MIFRISKTSWWNAHEQKQIEREWTKICNGALSLLKSTGAQRKIDEILIDNCIGAARINQRMAGYESFKKAKSINEMAINAAALLINHLSTLNDIIGIQPMQAPVGLAYALVYKNSETNPVGLQLLVERLTLAAESRKYRTKLNVETADSMCLDVLSELSKLLAAELAFEVFDEILNDLVALASDHNASTLELPDASAASKTVDLTITVAINKAANLIAAQCRRGCGNFIITSPHVLDHLSYTALPEEQRKCPSTLNLVGTLQNGIRVYVTSSSLLDHKILVGYKGASATDAGYILAPYVPIITTGPTVDPMTFVPQLNFIGRYAKTTLTSKGEGALSDSTNYYSIIDVNALTNLITAPVVDNAVQSDNGLTPIEGETNKGDI